METSSILFVVSTIICTLIFHFLLKGSRSRGRRLPPGPTGLPILGRLPFLSTNLHRCFADVSRSHGPVTSFRVGAKLFVCVSSPSAAAEVLRDHDAIFASHAGPLVTSIVSKGGLDILWAPYGPHWRLARRVVMRELMNSTVMESFRSLRRREVHRMVKRLRLGNVVDVGEAVTAVAMDVILGMVWDDALREGMGGKGGVEKELREVVDRVVDLGGAPNLSDFFPVLAPLDLQGLEKKMKVLTARFDAAVDAIVEHKRRRREEGGGEKGKERPKDFLQMLLDLIEKRDPENPLEMDHMRGIILDLVVAATDTTGRTIEWAMMELMRNPEIMAKAQEELDRVVGDNGILEESHLPNLRYLDAVVKETLRLHPVLPLLVPHTPSEDSTISGYTVPAGAWVFVNIWEIQRDPSLWDRPLEFRPERFLEESRALEYNGKNFEYLPFGRGRRICAGLNMGEKFVMYELGTLLHALNWKLPRNVTAIDDEEKFVFVLKKKEPLVLVPSLRKEQYLNVNV